MALTKNDIIRQVQELGFNRNDASDIVEILLEIIKNRLISGEDILVSGFGKFMVKDKAPRKGRNPSTGQELMLDARKAVTFRPSGRLKARINGKNDGD